MKFFAALGAAVLSVCSVPVFAAAPASAAPAPVTMTVVDVDPTTPVLSTTVPKPVSFTLNLVNNTAETLTDVEIDATRATPISSQSELDAAVKAPQPPSQSYSTDVTPVPDKPVTVESIAPGTSRTVVFRTTMGTDTNTSGICQCGTFVYPVYFTASTTDGAELAHAQTYLPSITPDKDADKALPQKSTVAWLWPILDRPHRLRHDNLFLDDDLAEEVTGGGRLSTLLDVLENVAAQGVHMTVVTDPDLIDSLAVMSTGKYSVTAPGGKSVAGGGAQVATDWLTRLRTVLTEHPDTIQLEFTAFADPAVEALSRSRLTWTATASTAEQQRVTTALGRAASTDLTWPAGEQVGGATLRRLRQQGRTTVVLKDSALTRGTALTATGGRTGSKDAVKVLPDAVAPLQTSAGTVTAAVTSTPIQALVRKIATRDASTGLPLLPRLVAELAIRVVTSVHTSHLVVIAPPRQLTVVAPAVAERMILETSATSWSRSITLGEAVQHVTPVNHGKLREYSGGRSLAPSTVAAVSAVAKALPVATALFADPSDATARLGTMGTAVQRTESTALLARPAITAGLAKHLRAVVEHITSSVALSQLYTTNSTGVATYTLTSKNTSLPATVKNNLDVPVKIRATIVAPPDFGLSAGTTAVRTLEPEQRVQLRIPVHLKRVGPIPVTVQVLPATGTQAVASKQVTIHSTALGAIGVVITVVAGAVLLLAILVRLVKRTMYRRRQKTAVAA